MQSMLQVAAVVELVGPVRFVGTGIVACVLVMAAALITFRTGVHRADGA